MQLRGLEARSPLHRGPSPPNPGSVLLFCVVNEVMSVHAMHLDTVHFDKVKWCEHRSSAETAGQKRICQTTRRFGLCLPCPRQVQPVKLHNFRVERSVRLFANINTTFHMTPAVLLRLQMYHFQLTTTEHCPVKTTIDLATVWLRQKPRRITLVQRSSSSKCEKTQ